MRRWLYRQMGDGAQSTPLMLPSLSQGSRKNWEEPGALSVADFPGLPATADLRRCSNKRQTSGPCAQHSPLLPCAHGWYLLPCHDAKEVQEQHLLPWQGQCTPNLTFTNPLASPVLLPLLSYPSSLFPVWKLSSPFLTHLYSASSLLGSKSQQGTRDRWFLGGRGKRWGQRKKEGRDRWSKDSH